MMRFSPAVRSVRALALAGACLLSSGATGVFVHPAAAQDRGPANRTLQGKVFDKNGNPVKGAVVYLKDERSTAIKTAVAEDDGSYRFVQLAQGTDYEVWAKVGQDRGASKTISSFDSKQQLVINLKVE